jgi:Domain of unknown function (DUF4345)
MMKLFLLVAGVFLIPVALSYGVDPAATLPKFMHITVEGTDQTHIFRALMALYLGMVSFLHHRRVHAGVAAGGGDLGGVFRILAGHWANSRSYHRRHAKPILLFYLAVELIVGSLGLLLLIREPRKAVAQATA